ncbi:MAG: carboxypeptidase regulatory-like domain-containing protein, partial [Silvibacterium sp.]|nr:carboxypeptidase regulatory-like domain-containing protein [Silvibacterium sp.]
MLQSGAHFCVLIFGILAFAQSEAQVTANLSGRVTDPSGAAVAAANVTARDTDTGISRTTQTDQTGQYEIFELPVGHCEVRASKDGFADRVRSGIVLVVGQDAKADLTLALGPLKQQVIVSENVPVVNTSTQDISGLVSEQQIKQLPLNGRSYDLLLTLNPGIVNFTSQKTGGTGVSNSSTGNNFAVSGNRPQQNLFLLNGVEFTGAAENNMQPGGVSGQLLGVDSVREFNVLRDTYGAEYGKRPGAQVIIVTQSGTNQLHGSAYEFLRNNDLDAPNYFDQGGPPPFQRNQFGGSLGGPLKRDKAFLFGNYEGLRQHLHQTSAAFVPDLASRAAAVPSVQPLLNLWPTPPANAPDFNGIA